MIVTRIWRQKSISEPDFYTKYLVMICPLKEHSNRIDIFYTYTICEFYNYTSTIACFQSGVSAETIKIYLFLMLIIISISANLVVKRRKICAEYRKHYMCRLVQ